MRQKEYDKTPGIEEVVAACVELNTLGREERNKKSLVLIDKLITGRFFDRARRAIMLLYLDQPERIEARYVLAAASTRHEDIFALRCILDEGCVGRQPNPKIIAGARELIAKLAQLEPLAKKRRKSEKGLEIADPNDAEDQEANTATG